MGPTILTSVERSHGLRNAGGSQGLRITIPEPILLRAAEVIG
jgi:hypothetical protein